MRFIALASCKSYTDRERFNIAYMVMISHGKLFEVAQRLKLFSYRIHKIVAILNTAAEPSAIEGYKIPYFDFTNNFLSVVNVLELARKNKIKVIQWSTNKVYSGDKINGIKRKELGTRFEFDDEK